MMPELIKNVSDIAVRNNDNAYLVVNQDVKEQAFLIPKEDGEFSVNNKVFRYTSGNPILVERISEKDASAIGLQAEKLKEQANGPIYPQSQITPKQLIEMYDYDSIPEKGVFIAQTKPELAYALLLKEEVMSTLPGLSVKRFGPGQVLIESMGGSKKVMEPEDFKAKYTVVQTMRELNRDLRNDKECNESKLG